MTDRHDVSLQDVYAARARLRGHILTTPLRESAWLSLTANAAVLLKLESVQLTNSFKIRGAMHAALRLAQSDRPRRLVTASAGNHGRAIAVAAARFGLTVLGARQPARVSGARKGPITRS